MGGTIIAMVSRTSRANKGIPCVMLVPVPQVILILTFSRILARSMLTAVELARIRRDQK